MVSSTTNKIKSVISSRVWFLPNDVNKSQEKQTTITSLLFSGLWEVPGPEEKRKGSSHSGLYKRSELPDQLLQHVEPTSLRGARLPHPEGCAPSSTTPPETLRAARRTIRQDGPHLQVRMFFIVRICFVLFLSPVAIKAGWSCNFPSVGKILREIILFKPSCTSLILVVKHRWDRNSFRCRSRFYCCTSLNAGCQTKNKWKMGKQIKRFKNEVLHLWFKENRALGCFHPRLWHH